MLARNPADNVAVELKHTEIYIVCQVQDKAKGQLHLFTSEAFQTRINSCFPLEKTLREHFVFTKDAAHKETSERARERQN